MSLFIASNTTLSEIVSEIEKLSPKEQHVLLMKLKRNELLTKAKSIAKGVKHNKANADEVVSRVNKNRKAWKKTS